MVFIDYATWIAFAMLSGIMEAFMYHMKDPNKSVGKDSFILKFMHKASFGLYKKPNEHAIFNLVRATILISLAIKYSLMDAVVLILCFVAMFPCLHDGYYYHTRNALNPKIYTLGFTSEPSGTGTSWSLSFVARLSIAIAGFIILILYLFT